MLNNTPSSSKKPHYHRQRNVEYQRHLQRIDDILKKQNRSERIRNDSVRYNKPYNQLDRIRISEENSRIVERLENISTKRMRKQSCVFLHRSNASGRMAEEQRKIAIENARMAERLIAKHSDIESRRNRIMKTIHEYQNLRKSMIKNRKALLPSNSGKSMEYVIT